MSQVRHDWSETSPRAGAWAWACLLVVLGLTCVVYAPTGRAGFYFDDDGNIVDATALHWEVLSPANLRAALADANIRTRPIANLSFAVSHIFADLEPRAYHWTNIVIHCLCGLALYWLILEYLGLTAPAPTPRAAVELAALLATALFLLHPLNTQAVSYVVQRMASLAALGSVLALACYWRGLRLGGDQHLRRARWWGLGLLAWLMAVGCKENAILVAGVVALHAFLFHGQRRPADTDPRGSWPRIGRAAFAALVLAGLASVAALVYAERIWLNALESFEGRDFSAYQRVLTQPRVQLFYLSLLVYPNPARLNLDHHFPPSRALLDPPVTAAALTACVALLLLAVHLARHKPRYGFPVLGYALLHSVEAGPINLELAFEHRMYLPSTMVAVLVAQLLLDLPTHPRWLAFAREHAIAARRAQICALLAFSLIGGLLAVATYHRNQVWTSEIGLWQDAASKSPNKARPQYNLGVAHLEAGDPDSAFEALSKALAIDPEYGGAHANLAILHRRRGQTGLARKHYQEALRIDPGNWRAHYNLGILQASTGDLDAALESYQRAIHLHPTSPEVYHNLGLLLARQDRPEQAVAAFHDALALDPGRVKTRYSLSLTHLRQGEPALAAVELRRLLRIAPGHRQAHLALGRIQARQGRCAEAVGHYEQAVDLAPTDGRARRELGACLLALGRVREALVQLEAAARWLPQDPGLQQDLRAARQRLADPSDAPPDS